MTDFLFHKVSEKEKADIKKQAKDIMDKFSEKLSKIDNLKVTSKKISEPLIERDEFERGEKQRSESDSDFRKRMFENAPSTLKGTSKNKDFIIAEKKKW
jgi:Asp-tRNA(Asn)/Glu-tRNA(Gln) amidotransferase C subunit|tara:strand:+ start:183 stop:479 length:297 start_codon:yes stop_codon:yes gene_type:complete